MDTTDTTGAPGVFVAFEGGEGSGKSTQAALLAEWLTAAGHDVLLTREPGDSEVGRQLRAVLLNPATDLSARGEALLYAADRAEHVSRVIRPALAAGRIVVSDRYVDSSLAYQGAGRDLGLDPVRLISDWATDGLVPALTVVLDIDPARGLARSREPADRIEAESLAFHERVRAAYRLLAAQDPRRHLLLDGNGSPEDVATAIRPIVQQMLTASQPAARP